MSPIIAFALAWLLTFVVVAFVPVPWTMEMWFRRHHGHIDRMMLGVGLAWVVLGVVQAKPLLVGGGLMLSLAHSRMAFGDLKPPPSDED